MEWTPELSEKRNIDEFVSKIKKIKFYRWVSKDRKRKFRINAFSSRKRSYEQGTKKVCADIKKRCYDQFLEAKKKGRKFNFTSDKLEHNRKGFKKFFDNVATLTFGVAIKCKKYGLKRNNNCIERDHQYSRALEKNSRGHKDFEGISALFDVGDVYYNYIDKIKLKLGDKYQLLSLIKMPYTED